MIPEVVFDCLRLASAREVRQESGAVIIDGEPLLRPMPSVHISGTWYSRNATVELIDGDVWIA